MLEQSSGWRGLCVGVAQRKSMRAETGQKSRREQGGPGCRAWLAYTSLPVIDDEATSSPTRITHRADTCARRLGCEHREPCLAHGFCGDYGYILESGRIMLDGPAKALADNKDVKEFY